VQIVLAAVSVAVWVANPFAAALLLPALHLWIVFVSPELRPRRAFGLALVALGLAAPALLALYYAHELGSGLLSGSWIVVLMLTGGHLGIAAAAAASITAGSAVAVVLVALQGKSHTSGSSEVTIRGPVSYAGPGSLGGTESALRR
jgi:hypothetical protein